jgi:hypothetical protein
MLAFVDAEDLCWVYVFLLFDRLDEAEWDGSVKPGRLCLQMRPENGQLTGVASAIPLAWIIVCEDQHLHKHSHKWILPWTAWTNTHGRRQLTLSWTAWKGSTGVFPWSTFPPFRLWKWLSIDMNV